MWLLNKLLNEKVAKRFSVILESICYIVLLVYVLGLVLSIIGRQQFILHTNTGTYSDAILAEEQYNWQNPSNSRLFTTNMSDDLRVWAEDRVDTIAKIAISATYAVHIIPLIISFWLISRVFRNVSKGSVFTNQNAIHLLSFGLIKIATALFVPFIKMGIVALADRYSINSISINTGSGWLNDLIPNIAAIIAAYIIHYGVQLQDDVDHTL